MIQIFTGEACRPNSDKGDIGVVIQSDRYIICDLIR